MSVTMVSENHIRLLVSAGLDVAGRSPISWRTWHEGRFVGLGSQLTPDTAQATGQMLWEANWQALNHRYPDTGLPEPRPVYRHRSYVMLDPLGVLAALSAYEYQCYELPQWWVSPAHQFVVELRSRMVHRLAGFGEREWLIH